MLVSVAYITSFALPTYNLDKIILAYVLKASISADVVLVNSLQEWNQKIRWMVNVVVF